MYVVCTLAGNVLSSNVHLLVFGSYTNVSPQGFGARCGALRQTTTSLAVS